MIQFSINMTIKVTHWSRQAVKAQQHINTIFTTEQDKLQQKTATPLKINMTLWASDIKRRLYINAFF